MKQIMLLSADKELSRTLKASLRGTEAKVELETASVKDAVDLMAKNPVPLVVVDLFVPESTGLEAMKQLKRVNENCMFLFLARLRTRLMIERAFRFGAHDVVDYPVSPELLRDTILHRLEAEPLADETQSDEESPKPARK